MHYQEIRPCPALRRYVECYWVVERPSPLSADQPEVVVPDGRPELIFHFGDRVRRHTDAGWDLDPRSFVFGQLERRLEIAPTGRVGIIGARFRPDGAHALATHAIHQMRNLPVSLRDLWPSAAELEERILGAASNAERLQLLERTLLRRLERPRRDDQAVAEALRWIAGRRGVGRVTALSRSLGLSPRQLERRFKARVGTTPKRFSRIVRVQHALRRISSQPRPSWVDVALDCGYYDQAHFIRDFRAFTGENPAAYVAARHELSDHLSSGALP